MKANPPAPAPALTSHAMAVAAGRKTLRVQKKLHEAETEMRRANQVLAQAPRAQELDEAVQRNAEAERKVHEAVEELEVVKEMLEHDDGRRASQATAGGKTGDGVRSLLAHLKPGSRTRP